MLLPCVSEAGYLPWSDNVLVLGESAQVTKKIGNRSIISVDRGRWGSMCKLYFILSDIMGDNFGQAGYGHWIGHE
jgi:hypothetical protein